MSETFLGVVLFFSNAKGYGFIEYFIDEVKQPDMFVHFSDIAMDGYRTLKKDSKVSFSVGQNNQGRPKAINVLVLDPG